MTRRTADPSLDARLALGARRRARDGRRPLDAALIAALLDGPRRFGELQEEVGGIAPNVLTQRLRQLERNALVVARPYSERPPRFVYELSAAGQELAGALRLIAGWGARNAGRGRPPARGRAARRWRRAGGARRASAPLRRGGRRAALRLSRGVAEPPRAPGTNARMLRLLGIDDLDRVGGLAQPATIAPALYLATGKRAAAGSRSSRSRCSLVYFVGGARSRSGRAADPARWSPTRRHHIADIVEIVVGAAMIGGARCCGAIGGTLRAARAARHRPRRAGRAALLGATITAVELPTAFPVLRRDRGDRRLRARARCASCSCCCCSTSASCCRCSGSSACSRSPATRSERDAGQRPGTSSAPLAGACSPASRCVARAVRGDARRDRLRRPATAPRHGVFTTLRGYRCPCIPERARADTYDRARWRRPSRTPRAFRQGRFSGCSTGATPTCAGRIPRCSARPEFAPPIAIPTAEYREQVLEWMQTLADEGLTAPGLSRSSSAARTIRARTSPAFETLAYGDLSLLVKFGVQFGLWGGAIQQLGTRIHHERYLKRDRDARAPGCFAMTETGHGSNVQQLGTTATYDPDDRRVRRQHADRRGAQGVHRQRRLPRPAGGGVRAADRRRGESTACTCSSSRSATSDGNVMRRRADRGLRREDGAERRRQRPDLVRQRPRPARRAAEPLRRRQRGRRLREPDRESEQALLHDARDARPGPRVHLRARRSAPPRPR